MKISFKDKKNFYKENNKIYNNIQKNNNQKIKDHKRKIEINQMQKFMLIVKINLLFVNKMHTIYNKQLSKIYQPYFELINKY